MPGKTQAAPEVVEADPMPAAPTVVMAAVPDGWNAMQTAPLDGKPVWLTDGLGRALESRWRTTRRVTRDPLGWHETGFWAHSLGGGQPIPFIPVAWRPLNAK